LYVKKVFPKNAVGAAERAALEFCISFFLELSLALQCLYPGFLGGETDTVTPKNTINFRIYYCILRLKY